jgi:hypothetical protein
MKLMWVLFMFFAVSILIFSTVGCAGKTADPIHYTPSQSPSHSVVILYHQTPFKKELVAGVAKLLKARQIEVTTDDLSNANEYPPVGADLVVLVVSVWAGQATGDALEYLDSHAGVSNVIMVSTSGRGSLTGIEGYKKYQSIETVTGASSIDTAGVFAEEITASILRRLGK